VSKLTTLNQVKKPPLSSRIRRNLKMNKPYYILMAPYMILFFMFTVLPVVMSLVLSFTFFDMLQAPRFVGIQNYVNLFLYDDIFIIAVRNTLILALITGPLSYMLAFFFAWLINELPKRLRWFMTLVFYAPSISGNAYLLWMLIFDSERYGYANAWLIELGIIQQPILWLQDPNYIIWILIIVQLWLSLGVSFLAFIAGLQTVNKELYEAGAIDGIRNRWQELWYITLPQMRQMLMFGAVMQITQALGIATVPIAIAGLPSVEYAGHTIVTHLMDYGSIRFEMGYASAIATILFILMLGTNMLVQKLLRRVGT
jgi:multiple sugar transport system permease protein